MTHIASTLDLDNKLSHLTSYTGYTLMDIDLCLYHGLMKRVSFDPNQYRLLIDNETNHSFTLPNPSLTNVHDKANWTFALEGQGETLDEPRPPIVPEYHPLPPSTRTTILSNNFSLQRPDVYTKLAELRREMDRLHQEVADLSMQLKVSDATHAIEVDFLY